MSRTPAAIVPPLNAEQTRVLKRVADGGKMEARRTYPHPLKYWLLRKDGYRYASPASETTVAALIELQLVEATVLDERADAIDYRVTPLGTCAIEAGTALPPDDDSQLDLLGDAA